MLSWKKPFICLWLSLGLTACGHWGTNDVGCLIDCDGKASAKREAKEHADWVETNRLFYERLVRGALTMPMHQLFAKAKRKQEVEELMFGLALLAGRDTSHIQDSEFLQNETWHHSDYWLTKARPANTSTQTTAIYVPPMVKGAMGTTSLIQIQSRGFSEGYNMAIACIESLNTPEGPPLHGPVPDLKAYACGGVENRNIFRALLRENP